MKHTGKQDTMLTGLFFRLMPIQVLIIAMGAVNSIVDGSIAGRFIDSKTVGVVGLHFSLVFVIEAVGGVMLGGTSVICGRCMGAGEIEKTKSVFSLNLAFTFIFASVLTALSLLLPESLATLLGADAQLMPALVSYIIGYAFGIIPQMLSQQLGSFLQMERQIARSYTGIAGMIISNVILDILFVVILSWGPMGLALATALSNWIYFLILVPYYFSNKAQLRFEWSSIRWGELIPLIKIGLPGALLVSCLPLRGLVINRELLYMVSEDALSAQSAFSMINGLFVAFALGIGATNRMLSSILLGEEDREALHRLMKIEFTKALPISFLVTLCIIIASAPITKLFFTDTNSEVFKLTYQLFNIYACCIPFIVLCQIATSYLQAGGHSTFVDILSICDGFFFMVIPALVLTPHLGALGVWIANPIGIILVLLLDFGYIVFFWKRFPRTIDEWLLLKSDFGVGDEDYLYIEIRDEKEVSSTSQTVQDFCDKHGIDRKKSYYCALCLEEMAGNIVKHGFYNDKKKHIIDVKVIYKDGKILLRLKDDCIPFNPRERADMLSDDDVTKNIGLRMVSRIAREMDYQNYLGLNVLSMTVEVC